MELKYLNEHKSISEFETIDLENFVILTGFNGSGKTHLLEAIRDGKCQIDNMPQDEIVLFDFKTFFLDNENTFNNQQINQEKQSAWGGFNQPNNFNVKNNLIAFRNNLGEENYKKVLDIGKGRPFLEIPDSDFTEPELANLYSNYKTSLRKFFNNNQNKGNPEMMALKSLAFKLDKTLDEITEDEFYDSYAPVLVKNDFLPTQIGKLFIDYWYKYQMFEYRKTREQGVYDEVTFRKEFEEKYGPRPWVLIEEILKSFETLNYTINNPEEIIIEPHRTRNFTLTLRHLKKDVSIPFDNLSSGERILFSLVLSIYKSTGDKLFPSALLLDEIDASLHPSQIQNLLNVINEVFIKQNGVKVILATHSPSTVALAEEKNIYVVNSDGKKRIQKQSKKEALRILSEGFITLEEGLQIFDQLARKELTIFTEGNNVEYLKQAINLYDLSLLSRVEIVDNLKDRTGKNQLATLYEFFLRMSHKNKVLFIYDCDVTTRFDENESTFTFIFSKNITNTKVTKGIENLFDESLFTDDFYPRKAKDDGGFQASLDKNKFAEFIISRNLKDDFRNFEELIGKIQNILEFERGQANTN